MKKTLLFLLALNVLFSLSVYGQTGKVTGFIKDTDTGDPLIGANVLLTGTTIGAAADVDGYFVILNVSPGTYEMKVSYIGYVPKTITGVIVNIDQTTSIDIDLSEQVLQTDEVVVEVAKIPIVSPDVAASTANISADQIATLPTLSINRVLGLQAGVESSAEGIVVRGGSIRETAYVVNGITLRDERDNKPFTGISVSAIENVQVTTGGFSAEYGDLRSGLVNIATREGDKHKYNFQFIGRYSPAAQKHFGISPHDPTSYWIRPFVDPSVAWTGTKNGAWNTFIQQQYPEFEGWNSISEKTLANDDPTDDLTPEAAQRLFLWEHRKQLDIEKPDYDIDMSLSGPVPGAQSLGNLRFVASYRRAVDQYIVPLSDDAYRDWTGQLKLTSDLSTGMKLMIDGLYGKSTGTNDNNGGAGGIFQSSSGIALNMSRVSFIDTRLFTTDYWAPSTIIRNSIGAKFTHVINASTFYEVIVSRFASDYDTNPGRLRDTTKIMKFGNTYWVDEAPYGFQPAPSTGIGGMRMGVGMSNSRDSSKIAVYTAKFDIVSQLDRYNQVKAGIQLIYSNNKTNYGSVDVFLPQGRYQTLWEVTPVRGALYLMDKLEFEGMIANVGIRFDYFDPGGEWWVYDPWTDAFKGDNAAGMDTLLAQQSTDVQFTISPRIGIAFPISIDSKLFFNYGHMRSFPTPENVYQLRRNSFDNTLQRIANPNNPLEKTIQYELGYEHNLFDQFLLRVAGYYKDVSLQPLTVRYVNRAGDLDYTESHPTSYQDVRGFEISLYKNRGLWVQGFLNYTYDVRSSGRFGYAFSYENPSLQRDYERTSDDSDQNKPVPTPYARANLAFFTPHDFGPDWGGFHLFGDWRLNLLGEWRNGFYFTWTGGGSIPGIFNNVQWRDSWNIDLRLSKTFTFNDFLNLEFILDVTNLFNFKQMSSRYGFVDGKDYEAYMKSLHLAGSISEDLKNSYINIPGEDTPGDYRISGEFTPIVPIVDITALNPTDIQDGAIYWDRNTQSYLEHDGADWVEVSSSRMQTIIDNKQYIDMPNQAFFSFLNPRLIYFGLKLSLAL